MAASTIFSHPIFQPGLVPLEEQHQSELCPAPGQPKPHSQAIAPHQNKAIRLAEDESDEREVARELIARYRKRRAGWLGHLRSFVAVNGGLAMINLLSAIGSGAMVPWVLYVTASWGIGFLIHGMSYRGWLTDHRDELARAEELLGVSLSGGLPVGRIEQLDEARGQLELASAPTLPEGTLDDGGWLAHIVSCREALNNARQSASIAEIPADVGAELEGQLTAAEESLSQVYDAALGIRRAITEIAPEGVVALDREVAQLDERLSTTTDERLATIFAANHRLILARREKLEALLHEEERLKATVDGLRLTAENLRLDAAHLGIGQVAGVGAALDDSLRQLDDEVEIARHIEGAVG